MEKKIIGSAIIHSNQLAAGKSVCDKLLDGPTHLTAGCQSGKTGVVIYAVDQFLNGFDIDYSQSLRYVDKDEDFNEKMKRTQIIWINARADNYLRDQTEKRLIEAFGKNKVLTRESISKKKSLSHNDKEKKGKLIGKVYIGHLSDLQIDRNDNLVQMMNIIDFDEPILFIVDESHVGQDKFQERVKTTKDGKITEYNAGVLDNFCSKLGIYLNQPKNKWNKRRYILSMSATRPSWSVYIEEFRKIYGNNYTPNIVHLHPGENYCGIAKDFDNVSANRFIQSVPFYDSKKKMVSTQIINEVKTLKNGKCVLIRCSLDESDAMIESLIRCGFTEDLGYAYKKCGHNYKNHTAESLNNYLNDCTELKTDKVVIFIENFLGAGATFPNVRIHAQFERHNKSNPTAHIQSVGRSFGYSDEYTNADGKLCTFNKKDANYKIYCDLDIMKFYKDGFDTDKAVYNDSAMKKSRKTHGENVWICNIVPKNPKVSVHKTLQKHYFNKFENDDNFRAMMRTKQNTARISYTKTTYYSDYIHLINNKIVTDENNKGINGRIICINGENPVHNKKNEHDFFEQPKNSFEELMENIRTGKSWLCDFGVTEDTFKDYYVCVYVHKEEDVIRKIDYKLKKDSVLSLG